MIVKLLVFPAVFLAVAMIVGVTGEPVLYLVLCGAMPTAMNGYVLAKQMGGDADLYATVTTLQTLMSFATIPLALLVAGQFAGG
ncbi:AEC family transporter [Mesorhizobium sp. CN5-321]|uniref:AEC family transporter n=1 Tax=Mesorhizobium hunchu TaxID=3157708 RepID=UPI0032B76BB6